MRPILVLLNNKCFSVPETPQCKADEFQCSSGECIKFFQRCDMVVDCPNGEDESFCRKWKSSCELTF